MRGHFAPPTSLIMTLVLLSLTPTDAPLRSLLTTRQSGRADAPCLANSQGHLPIQLGYFTSNSAFTHISPILAEFDNP
jgi:hypothetical protein